MAIRHAEDYPGLQREDHLVGVAAVGVAAWTLLTFMFSDIGGPTTVLTSVMIGLVLWWAVRPHIVSAPGAVR